MSTAVPPTVKVNIPPLPSTESTVIVASLAVVAPPQFVPTKVNTSFCT
mgnify:CR=1 FL=1